MASFPCHHCGAPLDIGEPIPRDAECPACRGDVRCCLNCRHYDTRYHNACRETEADPVEDKHRRNFCEYFTPSRAALDKPGAGSKERQARAGLDALFGGKPATRDRASDARQRLEDLFGKKPKAGE
jgi:hypothetical protein